SFCPRLRISIRMRGLLYKQSLGSPILGLGHHHIPPAREQQLLKRMFLKFSANDGARHGEKFVPLENPEEKSRGENPRLFKDHFFIPTFLNAPQSQPPAPLLRASWGW